MNHTTNKETHHVTRLAKAMSAFNFGRSGSADGRDAVALATRGASLRADGSGASSHARASLTVAALLGAALMVLAFATYAQAGNAVVKVIGGTTVGTQGGQFNTPRGIAVNQSGAGGTVAGDFFVVDGLNHRIQQFRADGTWVAAFGRDVITNLSPSDPGSVTTFQVCTVAPDCKAGATGPLGGEFNNPQGIAIDQSDGSIYVTESTNRRVTKFKMEAGVPVFDRAWGADVALPAGGNAFEICIATVNVCKAGATGTTVAGGVFGTFLGHPTIVPSGSPGAGEILVADAGNRRVQRFEADGDFLYAFGWDVDTAGAVGQLEKCTATCRAGVAPGEFESPALGQFPITQPTRVAVDSSGIVYTVEAGAESFRVQRFNAPLTSASLFSPESFKASTPASDVQVNPTNDHVFVARSAGSPVERHVLQLSASGSLLDTHAQGAGLPTTAGLGLSGSTGRLYLSANHRIFILDTPVPPTATIDPVTTFTSTTATFTGHVNPQGLPATYRFEYSDDDFATKKTAPLVDADAGSIDSSNLVQQNVVGLEPNTTYKVRLVATKSFGAGTTTTAPQAFTTPATAPRIVSTGTFPGGSDTSVVLFATIDPQGQPTSYHFEYGTDASYGLSTPVESVGSANAERVMLVRLNDLAPDTTYHFKAFASNTTGPVESEDETFFTATSQPCPNEVVRTGASASLPDCRAYEMVSPIDKNGGDIETAEQEAGLGSHLSTAYRQASLNGGKITYSSATAFGDAVGGHFSNQYLATRSDDEGWSTHSISSRRGTTVLEPQGPLEANLRWYTYSFFEGFTPDLSSAWIRDDNVTPLAPGALEGYVNLYRRDNTADTYEPLTNQGPFGPNALPVLSEEFFSNKGGPRVLGASSDLRHQVLVANAALTPDAVQSPAGFNPGTVSQLYDLVDGELHLVSVLPNGTAAPTNSFAGTAGTEQLVATQYHMLKNVVSDDGSRIFWSTTSLGSGPGAIYVRENPGEEQSALNGSGECTEPEKACTIHVGGADTATVPTNPSRAQFWAASADGSQVLFSLGTHPNRTLHLFNVDTRSTTQIAGQSFGVSAASEDLSHIYFVSKEDLDLAGGAVAGDVNLYHYHEGSSDFVGALSGDDVGQVTRIVGGGFLRSGNVTGVDSADVKTLVNPVLNQTRATPDGQGFTFMSNNQELSEVVAGYDNRDVVTGKSDFEVFHYDAEAERLTCVSCNPSGARPRGTLLRAPYSPIDLAFTGHPDLRAAASIPTHEQDLHASRILSDDGQRLFFHSDEALLPTDTNGVQDVYQWQAPDSGSCHVGDADYVDQNNGCISLISTGRDGAKSEFIDADPTGEEVFLSTDASLDPRDPGLRDIYVAKVGGGFLIPQTTAPCEGEACQSPPPPPIDPTPSSSTFQGSGDPRPGKARKPRCSKGKRKVKARNGKTRCVKRKNTKHLKRRDRANNSGRVVR